MSNLVRILLAAVIIILVVNYDLARSEELPANAKLYLPKLKSIIDSTWPNISPKSTFAGQIEQETCISLKRKKCWSPYAELNTSREYGFGLGQITIAYDSSGKERFNNFLDVKKIDKRLEKWGWKDRFNPEYQLIALVAKDKYTYNLMKFNVANDYEKLAFMLAAYNGGLGGVIKDRQICEKTPGCNVAYWFNNVEKTSYKAKIAVAGYGKSFFEINREYVRNILKLRRMKYIPYLGS